MTQRRTNPIIELLLCIMLGYFGVHRFYAGKKKSSIIYLCTIGLFGIGWIVDIILIIMRIVPKSVSLPKSVSVQAQPVSAPVTKKVVPDGEMNYNLFSDFENHSMLAYEYEQNICLDEGAFQFIPGNGGKPIEFRPEPKNEYDRKAVAIYLNGSKLGYVYRGTVQSMVNDYLKRSWIVRGYINKYSASACTATYKVAFYKPLDIFEAKKIKLIKTSKAIGEGYNRADNLFACDEGEILTVDFDEYDETAVVYNESHEEIGELPKAAITFIQNHQYEKIIGVLNSCEEDDNGKPIAYITIYLIT